jgi:hypothetical protein
VFAEAEIHAAHDLIGRAVDDPEHSPRSCTPGAGSAFNVRESFGLVRQFTMPTHPVPDVWLRIDSTDRRDVTLSAQSQKQFGITKRRIWRNERTHEEKARAPHDGAATN